MSTPSSSREPLGEGAGQPLSSSRPGPAVWLLGAHGGAGVSTLTHYMSGFAGDTDRRWPAGNDVENESPYVVIVARETSDGLKAAHRLIIEHRDNGYASDLLGLITVAGSPSLDKTVRQYRDIVAASVPAQWSIGWHRFLAAATRGSLPRWHPLDPIPTATKTGGATVPADVVEAVVGMVTAMHRALPHLRTDH